MIKNISFNLKNTNLAKKFHKVKGIFTSSFRLFAHINFFAILVIIAIKHIYPSQGIFVVYGLMDGNDEGEGRGQLDSAAELLVTPVQAAQSLGQVTTARTLKTVLQKLGFVRFVPGTLIPVNH